MLSHCLASAVAVLDPVQVDHAEGGGRDAGGAVVVVLVDVQVEGGVAVDIVGPQTRPQRLLHRLVRQPVVQFGRSAHVVDDALSAHGGNPRQPRVTRFKSRWRRGGGSVRSSVSSWVAITVSNIKKINDFWLLL